MELNKHSFPVKLTLEEAILIFQKEFDKKGYKGKITKDNIHLNITPFWVCFYDIDCKIDGKYQHVSAQTALNSLTNKIEENFLKILDVSTPTLIKEIDISYEKIEIRIKKSLVKLEEAKETILKMLSCKYSVEKDNVSLSGFEEMYIPIWRCNLENMEIYFDGVIGKINNFEKIIKRQKSTKEIFTETLLDIKNPKKFFEYFINLVVGVFKALISVVKFLVKNWYFTLIVLVVITLIIFFF